MGDLIIVKAKVKILSEAEGGFRKTGIKTGYRPNHVFEYIMGEKMITGIGDLVFDDVEYLYPGDEKELIIRFVPHPVTDKYIHEGRKWQINEGSRLIGNAEILEIINK